MPAPNPAYFKNLIPAATSSLCEKFNKLLVGLSTGIADWVAFEYSNDGNSMTDEMKNIICALQCPGTGGSFSNPSNPNMPTPGNVNATDGSFSDKVRVTWDGVTPPSGSVSNYLIYRNATESMPPSTLIGTVSGSVLTFDDTTPVPGIIYWYSVKATNGVDESAFGGPNAGNAGTIASTWPQTTDLRATQGIPFSAHGSDAPPATDFVRLMFLAPIGTTKFDVYRNTTNDFSGATKIGSNIVAVDTISQDVTPISGTCISNDGAYLYFDQPPSMTTKYYYWVKTKADAPPQVSPASNVAIGWVTLGTGDTGATTALKASTASTLVCPAGKTKLRLCMIGGGGAGSGSTSYHSGGGGGAGGVLLALVAVAEGDEFTFSRFFKNNPSSGTGHPPALLGIPPTFSQDQYEGQSCRLTRTGDSKRIDCYGGYNGQYNNDGTGPGGSRASAAGVVESGIVTTELGIFEGTSGENANGTRGGRGGATFGSFLNPPAHFLAGSFAGNSGNNPGSGGGGSSIYADNTGGSNVYELADCFYCWAD